MRASDRRLLIVAGIGTTAFVLAYLFLVDTRRVATSVYVLLLGSLVLVALAGRLATLAPARTSSIFRRGPTVVVRLPGWRRRAQRSDLEMLEGRLLVSSQNAADLHSRLRPMLREIAAARLARRYGLSLDRDAGASRTLLGEALWEVVRPDRPAPGDRSAPGPGIEGLRPLIERLEEVG